MDDVPAGIGENLFFQLLQKTIELIFILIVLLGSTAAVHLSETEL